MCDENQEIKDFHLTPLFIFHIMCAVNNPKKGLIRMSIDELNKYKELRDKLTNDTNRIFDLTVAKDCTEEAFVDSFDIEGDAVVVTWSDTTYYEKCYATFPFRYYAMTDEEVVSAWENDRENF